MTSKSVVKLQALFFQAEDVVECDTESLARFSLIISKFKNALQRMVKLEPVLFEGFLSTGLGELSEHLTLARTAVGAKNQLICLTDLRNYFQSSVLDSRRVCLAITAVAKKSS